MITINLNDVREVVEVTIGDHVYNVRRMGSGEELEASASMRRAGELIGNISRLQAQYLKATSDPDNIDEKEMDKLTKKVQKAADSLEAEQLYQFNAYVKLFDDGGDGSKSRELLSMLSHEDRKKLLEDIFSQKEVLDASKANDAENGSESVTGDE